MDYSRIAPDVVLGEDVKIYGFVNLYGCEIGAHSKIGTFVEIQKGARIGRNCKISSHSFVCEGVAIEDGVFVGHGVMFTNDRYPAAVDAEGRLLGAGDGGSIVKVRSGAAPHDSGARFEWNRRTRQWRTRARAANR